MKKLIIGAMMALAITSASTVNAGAEHQNAGVNWHPQRAALGNTGAVADAEATLVRNSNGATYRLRTSGLTPGNVYTLWLVVVNEPGGCAGSPCTAGDILLNSATRSQVTYAAGHVVGGETATFAGHVRVGPLAGWLDGRALEDAATAEIHLIVNDHGPAIPGMVSDMLSSYRGGCSDTSPFPGIFPPSALADGISGPNTCRLTQSAVFLPPTP